jgi:hypothetical protein
VTAWTIEGTARFAASPIRPVHRRRWHALHHSLATQKLNALVGVARSARQSPRSLINCTSATAPAMQHEANAAG